MPADLRNLDPKQIGQKLNFEPGNQFEKMEFYATPGEPENGDHNDGAVYRHDITVTDAGAAIQDLAIVVRTGLQQDQAAANAAALVLRGRLYCYQRDVRDTTNNLDTDYVLTEQGAGTAVDTSHASSRTLPYGSLPWIEFETDANGAATIRVQRVRRDTGAALNNAFASDFRCFVIFEIEHAHAAWSRRVRLTDFD